MAPSIYSAVYSGVPVYEMLVQDVPVMRRISDNYMNATHILKVAGFSKPKRTKILEREVLQGEHEKIQGGYGKYQGTWIPFGVSRHLARKYHVEDILAPMLDFDPATDEVGVKPSAQKVDRDRAPRRKAVSRKELNNDSEYGGESEASSDPSPLGEYGDTFISPSILRLPLPPATMPNSERQKQILAAIWAGKDYSVVLNLLRISSTKFNIDFPLDNHGNTPLAWSAALGRLEIVKHLLKHGANIHAKNKWGEGALVNAVLRCDPYANQSFPTLLKMLKNTALSIDGRGQTLMHHIVLRCTKGDASGHFYFESLSAWIMKKGERVAGFLDVGDENGDTVLHFATRCKTYRIVEVLVKLGASYSTRNNAGISSLDLVGGDTKLIALFGEAVAVSTGAKVSRKSRSPKIGGSGSETDKEVEHVDQNEEQKFEWHGKKPWSEAKDVPVTRLQVFLELRSGDDDSSTLGKRTQPVSPQAPKVLVVSD